MTPAGELRTKSREALDKLLLELCREYFNLRMQKGSGQPIKPHRLKGVKRDIARVKTVLNEPGFNPINNKGAAGPGGAR